MTRRLALPLLTLLLGPSLAFAADPGPTITLGPRTACVTPTSSRQARADGGIVEVQLTAPNVLTASLTGAVAANAILGCESAATQSFHLEQEFVVEAPGDVTMTFESTLVGLVRARHRAGAEARLASARVCPTGSPDSPLVLSHPPFDPGPAGARLCNQRLTPIKVPGMPAGRYVLTADFVLAGHAGGVADGHALADFSPTASLPADWVRSRDPFQGVDKKDFGFRASLTVESAGSATVAARPATGRDAALRPTAATESRPLRSAVVIGLDRHALRR